MKEEDIFWQVRPYSGKLLDPMVWSTVNKNKQISEPNSELIDTLLTETSTPEQEISFYYNE